MATYSYAECLQNSYKVNWRIDDVLGAHEFDTGRRWLPARLSGADAASGLSAEDRIRLTHVEMGAYAHLFGYVEEFIAPKVLDLARDFAVDDREAFDALTNFAAEEVKHMNLFRQIRARVDRTLGFPLALIGDEQAVARAVLGKHTGAVLLLTAAIEWFTQLHYLTGFKDDDGLDPLTKAIFRAHWQEESQHARMDHLETLRAFRAAVDGLLQKQAALDVDNLERYRGRPLDAAGRQAVQDSVLRAKRYTFIESGVTHPNFQALFGEVATPDQQARVQAALAPLLAA